MIVNITKKIILYPLFGILICSIIKILPNNNLNNFDTILISIITIILCACLEKTIPDNIYYNPTVEPLTQSIPKIKINFPFSYLFLKETMDEMRLISSSTDDNAKNKQIIQRIRNNSKSNEYFEMLIQLMQKDLELVYRYITPELFNNLNVIIMGLKLRKTKLTNTKILPPTQSKEMSPTMKKYIKSMTESGKYMNDTGFINNLMEDDMKYTMFTPSQHEKLGTFDSTFNNKWDNDYVLLNTDKWRPPTGHHMYKCKMEKECPVCPNMTSGYPVKLKEFDLARKVLPPDIINQDYIREKLLTGLA